MRLRSFSPFANLLLLLCCHQCQALVGNAIPHTSTRMRTRQLLAVAAATYTVRLPKPLGIQFEENVPGQPRGVSVAGLVPGGNAERDGRVLVGDTLVRVSAVSFGGQSALLTLGTGQQYTSFQRDLIPATKLNFDTIMGAIGSNEGRYGYTDVVMELRHTPASVPRPAASRVQRFDGDKADVQWDAARGVTSNGRSTPIRPGKDNF